MDFSIAIFYAMRREKGGKETMLQELVNEMKNQMKKTTEGMHTALPGEITVFDPGKGLATVQPKAKFKKPNGETMDFPVVSGVPVVFPQVMGQDATIAYPIKPGDGCLIVFAESALDYWMYGKETDTTLWFDLSNAICIPGLFTKANATMQEACSNNAVVVNVSGTKLTVKSGVVQIDAASVVINGDVTLNGSMTATGDVKANSSISLATHTHGGDSGGSTTGPS